MSGEVFEVTRVKRSRKKHRCFWCGEIIERHTSYVWWKWVDDDIERIKCHPECRDAWHEVAREDFGGYYECGPYENERGK